MEEFDLERFVKAQNAAWCGYDSALAELRAGQKQSHWIWYIFPQLAALGHSSTARYYGISGAAEAAAYLENELLRDRLVEISQAVLEADTDDPEELMGAIDALKLRSSMTLFANMPGADPVFRQVLEKYYGGREDRRTVELLSEDWL